MILVFSMMKPMMPYFWLCILTVIFSCKNDPAPPYSKLNNEGKFQNPILRSAPDPWVIQKNEWYYVTHTTGRSILLYRTKEMSDLGQATVKIIWTPPAAGANSKNIWAPELHFINNKWYFYYAADDGNNENHRIWVLENSSADPFTDTWVDKGELELPQDRWAIDGTVFKHNGQLYFLWSGWEGTTNVRQDIFITRLNDPWTATGQRIMLSKPELSWELVGGAPAVNEAPQFFVRGDKMFITYSASGCWTDDYSLGLLSASVTADLLAPSSWAKSSQPILTKNPSGLVYGPGHNTFFKSVDGTEDWIAYHANESTNAGCGSGRSLRMQKFTWNASGFPEFGVPLAVGAFIEVPSGEN